MEKPVRIIENEKIRHFNDRVRTGLEKALNFMLNNESAKIQISVFEPFLMPIEGYLQAYKKQSVLIKIYSDQDYKGELYWFFELKTAVLLGSLMRMVPETSLEEKLQKGIFDETDQDAFGEVGNQLSGILDRAFRSLTQKNIHLRMDFNKVVYPSDTLGPDRFLNKEEYVVLLATITIPKQGGQKLTLLLPRSLYEVMLNLEVSLDGVKPKRVLIYSWSQELSEKIQTQVNSRRIKVIAVERPDDIISLVDQEDVAAIGIDLKKLLFPLQHQDMILLKRLASNRTLTRLPHFITWHGATKDQVEEVIKMGLPGATVKPFAEFAEWTKSFTQNPG